MPAQQSETILAYIGTYSSEEGEGLHLYRLDPSSGALTFISKTTDAANPFFLAVDSRRRYLYAANVIPEFQGKPGGSVAVFALDPKTGEPRYLNEQAAGGTVPCHLSVGPGDRHVLVANYGSGSVSVLPVEPGGGLGPATDTVQHQGSSVDKERQEGPHVHSITLDPAGRHAFAADLGTDKVMVYELDAARGRLKPGGQPSVPVKAGAGPRHFAFHPGRRFGYLINELDNTVTAFGYDEGRGALAEIQTIPTLPGDFKETSYCADVQVHPSGRFLYGSNRGHDSVAIFAIDEASGRLTPVGHEPTQGQYPWNIGIDPTAAFLLAANQRSDSVVVFRIDPQTGRLTPAGQAARVPRPVCVKMIRMGA